MDEQPCIYRNPNSPIEHRVKDLLTRMTLQEKLAQMTQIERTVASYHPLKNLGIAQEGGGGGGGGVEATGVLGLGEGVREAGGCVGVEGLAGEAGEGGLCSGSGGGIWCGSVLNAGGSTPFDRALSSDWADMIDGFQKLAMESRLGIPVIYGTDAVHGNNNVFGATIFPHNVNLGAARDADLAYRIGVATALEVRASGAHYTFAPCVAVCKDPRWGRCYESYSEDTEIVRKMTSIVSGLQGNPPREHPNGYPYVAGRKSVIACAKHFVGDGGTDKGINEGNTITSFEDLERIHMAPYLDCIAQGVCTVMASYSRWNGTNLHAERFLLTEILKEKLGFKGFVISDWEGIDRICEPKGADYRFCVSSAINAGIDMVMVPFGYEKYLQELTYLVESKEIPLYRIDDAVERILRVKFVAGLFEHPYSDRSLLDVVGCKLHRDLAREAVRKSLVLLKNGKDPKNPFLPLDKYAKKVLVAGTHADNLGYQCGGWTITWDGGSGRLTTGNRHPNGDEAEVSLGPKNKYLRFHFIEIEPVGTTILDAIKDAVGDGTQVVYDEFPSPDTLSKEDFSYAVVVVGEAPYAEFRGDNSELSIPFNGADLISAVADRIPTLVILVSGRPLVLEPWLLDKMDGLIAAFLPGSEGNGVTDLLFGDCEFEGLLPVSWFKNVKQLPLNAGQNSYDPLFPLGFGLKTTKTNIVNQ
ncbi:hypothetical protein KSS87_009561 [Heliosperma pusillum]|nr:hypothetical protein KSS87_009561 [Heliosperma pusillum]